MQPVMKSAIFQPVMKPAIFLSAIWLVTCFATTSADPGNNYLFYYVHKNVQTKAQFILLFAQFYFIILFITYLFLLFILFYYLHKRICF